MENYTKEANIFTVTYAYLGQLKSAEVQEVKEGEVIKYKCRLIPATIELLIRRYCEDGKPKWEDTTGVFTDLAEALGNAITLQRLNRIKQNLKEPAMA